MLVKTKSTTENLAARWETGRACVAAHRQWSDSALPECRHAMWNAHARDGTRMRGSALAVIWQRAARMPARYVKVSPDVARHGRKWSTEERLDLNESIRRILQLEDVKLT